MAVVVYKITGVLDAVVEQLSQPRHRSKEIYGRSWSGTAGVNHDNCRSTINYR